MHIHDGGHQGRVVGVIQVANKEGNFISGCNKDISYILIKATQPNSHTVIVFY